MLKNSDRSALNGDFSKTKIAIVQALYNQELTENLTIKCVAALISHGLKKKQIEIFKVPGSLEVPLFCQHLAKKKKYDAIIALGVVIKGETHHFEVVTAESARGCMNVSLAYHIPIIYEIIPAYTLKTAQARAGQNNHNKGIEAARAALAMISALRS